MRMEGNPNWCKIRNFNAHDPANNKLKDLSSYEPEVLTEMMTSKEWTRAAIFREPKERILSAFLDKAVKEDYYVRKCCKRIPNKDDAKQCETNEEDFESFLHFVTKYPKYCFDVHWQGQMDKLDEKLWPYINFIGYQHNLVEDAKTLLQSLTSTRDPVAGRTAWERYGVSGWGNDNELCEKRPHSFLEENSSTHHIDSGKKMKERYTPEIEKFVEKNWAREWEQERVKFPKVVLFPQE